MNYYERHLGDYARDTGHLTPLEHGVYTLLLDRYYATEQGIPEELSFKISRARTKEEKAAVVLVLSEFFSLEDGLWINVRAEDEISRARVRIGAAKKNGQKGGRPKKNPAGFESETQQKPDGFSLGSEIETGSKALHTPDSIHQKDQELLPSASPNGDPGGAVNLESHKAERLMSVARDAVAAYNALLGKPKGLLSAVHLVNDVRRDQVKRVIPTARLICQKQFGTGTISREFWDSYFGECDLDPWKRGEGPYTGTHSNWRPDFEYLTRKEVMTTVFDSAMSRDDEAAA